MKKQTKKDIVAIAYLPLILFGLMGGSMIFGEGGLFPPSDDYNQVAYFLHMCLGLATTLACGIVLPVWFGKLLLGKDENHL